MGAGCRSTLVPWLAGLVAVALLALPFVARGQSADEFDAVTGYRIARYRAPVPEEVPGAKRIFFDDVEKLIAERHAILLDVMAAEGGGANPVTGQWRLTKARQHIPGSHWLPNTGKGLLEPGMESYFKSNLVRLTGGDLSRAVIIYCQADCWMGWNAAKRAASYGYTAVHWYPEGTDGWRDWDGTLAAAEPVPMAPADAAHSVPQHAEEVP